MTERAVASTRRRQGLRALAIMVGAMWLVESLDQLAGLGLDRFGILPRSMGGLIGIPLAPFLHGDFGHLISNTPPLLILGWLVSLRGAGALVAYSTQIILLGGAAVWLFARGGAVHIGASGLVFGFFGFVVAMAWFERRLGSIAGAAFALVSYAGIVWGILPSEPGVSWEGHLYGLLAGIAIARLQTLAFARDTMGDAEVGRS